MMPTNHQIVLPPGWSKTRGSRPAYQRTDGYMVKMDGVHAWGIRAPGENIPFDRGWSDQHKAMQWVDSTYPIEGNSDDV